MWLCFRNENHQLIYFTDDSEKEEEGPTEDAKVKENQHVPEKIAVPSLQVNNTEAPTDPTPSNTTPRRGSIVVDLNLDPSVEEFLKELEKSQISTETVVEEPKQPPKEEKTKVEEPKVAKTVAPPTKSAAAATLQPPKTGLAAPKTLAPPSAGLQPPKTGLAPPKSGTSFMAGKCQKTNR